MKAAVYCHTSRGGSKTLGAQEAHCRRLAVERGADDILTITDYGPCPPTGQRPGIAKLLRLVHSGEIGLVVVDEPRRLSRRLVAIRELSRELASAGARLVFVS